MADRSDCSEINFQDDKKRVYGRLKLTVPREPNLETARRAQRKRVIAGQANVAAATHIFKARPLNRKILEAPTLPLLKKTTPKLPEFQEFHLRTEKRAIQRKIAVIVDDEKLSNASGNNKTPPIQASPEIQTPPSFIATSTTPICHAAGHIHRKSRRRGILTTRNNYLLDSDKAKVIGSFDEDDGNIEANVIGLVNNSGGVSMLPSPAEDTIHCLLSPCSEKSQDQKENSENGSCRFQLHSPCSSLFSDEFASGLCNDSNNKKSVTSSCGTRMSTSSLSPGEVPPFSTDTVGSGNVIQTLESNSSSGKKHSDSELDLQKILHDQGSLMSTSTSENVWLSHMRVSWREELVSRIFEMNDEFDSCRYLSDEEEDVDGCYNDQLKSCPKTESNVDIMNYDIPKNDIWSTESEPKIEEEKEKKLPSQVSCSCAESISTDGGGLAASGDSDGNQCYKNQLFQGRNVVIEQSWGAPMVTTDGVTVTKSIEFKDKLKNIGGSLVKQGASATNDVAGDGTTCATVFTEGCKLVAVGMNAMDLRRGTTMAVDNVVINLKSRARIMNTSEEIAQVGTILANGEREVGDLIAKALEKVGKEGVITKEGRNVVIEQSWGAPMVTTDGVTVAKSIGFKDKVKNIGGSLVKQGASATNDVAGDGTTCATVLTRAIFTEGCKSVAAGMNAMDLRRGTTMAVDNVVINLKSRARIMNTSEEIAQVGTILANGEREVGDLIAKALEKVGKEGVITKEDGKTLFNELEVVEGKLDRGYISRYFITNLKNQKCELEYPLILIHDKKILNLNVVFKVLELTMRRQRPLLVVAEDVASLILNKLCARIKVCAISAPGFGESRKANMEDLATLTGGDLMTEEIGMDLEKVNLDMLGSCKKESSNVIVQMLVTISKDATVVLDGAGYNRSIEERCEQIRLVIELSTSDYDKEKLQERLVKLSGGVAMLKIGGASEAEVGEKKDRVTDALNGAKADEEEGGGIAFLYAAKELDTLATANFDQEIGVQIMKNALMTPVHKIASIAGIEGAVAGKLLEQDLGNDAAKGTIRATILTRAIFTEGCKSVAASMNVMDLRHGIAVAVDNVATNLKSRARMIRTSEEIAQVWLSKPRQTPVHTIASNGGVEGAVVVGKLLEQDDRDRGEYDAAIGEYVGMVKAGMTFRIALADAARLAGKLVSGFVLMVSSLFHQHHAAKIVVEFPKSEKEVPVIGGGWVEWIIEDPPDKYKVDCNHRVAYHSRNINFSKFCLAR